MVTIFWKRPDNTWWTDKLSQHDISEGFLCGFCGVPSQTLKWNGLAQTKGKR